METIALFGGSFDPPHIGHEAIVRALLELGFVDKVVIMPTFLNPFKSQSHADATQRLEWLRKIFASNKRVIVESYEVDLGKKVPAIESVKHLLKQYKKIYLVIGADNLASLKQWYHYEDLKELVTFVVASRDNIVIPDDFISLDVKENVSSTSLRENMDKEKLPKECAVEILQFYKEKNGK
ncbi:MAG: nicotinate (nicotinamide) nucleotide adenylyltransferase [Sulfurimonas sp.]|jgi:nicotinate-nucleotide adenylyltransferase|nr:nicotinate (nicotinamide) nucleotide adenylyltransferase [Sulfurimonas sp.]